MAIQGTKAAPNGNPVERFRTILLERRMSLLKDARSIEQEEEMAGDAPGFSLHLAELGTDRSTHDLNLDRMEAVTREIQEIDAALERVLDGSFGGCEVCGERIPKERLEAIPYTRLCLRCKMAEESF